MLFSQSTNPLYSRRDACFECKAEKSQFDNYGNEVQPGDWACGELLKGQNPGGGSIPQNVHSNKNVLRAFLFDPFLFYF